MISEGVLDVQVELVGDLLLQAVPLFHHHKLLLEGFPVVIGADLTYGVS